MPLDKLKNLKVSIIGDNKNDLQIIQLSGHLTSATADEFNRNIEPLFKKGKYRFIMDCSELKFISSEGIARFLDILEKTKENNGILYLTNLRENVYGVLELANIHIVFSIFDTVESAIATLSKNENVDNNKIDGRKIFDNMMERKEITIEADSSNLLKTRSFVQSIVSELGFSDTDVHDIIIAVDEAVSNIMEHAYKKVPYLKDKKITLKIEYNLSELTIYIQDNAPKFDPNSHELPNIDEYIKMKKDGGLGRWLIFNTMNDVKYNYIDGVGNQLVMTKFYKQKS